jgi:outer membrane protein
MPLRLFLPCLLALTAVSPSALVAEPLDLLAAYRLAIESDPALREAQAELEAAREQSPQARAQLLPSLNLSISRQDRVTDGTRVGQDPDTGEIGLVDFDSDDDSTSYSLQLRQPLFRWDRFVGLGQAQARVAEAEAQYEAAMQNLVIRTADAYFDLLAAMDSLASARANEEAIERQHDRARRRFDVGLVAVTDVQEARAAFDQAVADRISAERQVNTAREQLREIIGIHTDDIRAPAPDLPLDLPEPADPEAWVMLEMFRSRAAWDEHMRQPYNSEGNKILEDLLREPSHLRLFDEK